MKRWKGLITLSIAGAMAICLAMVVGYFVFRPETMVIVGPAMAELYEGQHGVVQCNHCQHEFHIDLEDQLPPGRLTCPNCANLLSEATPIEVVAGEEVSIDSRIYRSQGLGRFDVVVFQVPGEPDKLAVRRIIGLPGETVSIDAGRIYIDGEVLPLDDVWGPICHIPVHSLSGYSSDVVFTSGSSPPPLPSRWQPQAVDEPWQEVHDYDFEWNSRFMTSNGFVYEPPLQSHGIAWLEYQHANSSRTPGLRADAFLDDDSYHPNLSRPHHEVFDYQLRVGFVQLPGGLFAIRCHDGWQWWRLELDERKQSAQLYCHDQLVATAAMPARDMSGTSLTIRFTHDRVIVENDSEADFLGSPSLIDVRQRPITNQPRQLPGNFLAVGAAHQRCVISSLDISRFLYYLGPDNTNRTWNLPQPLGPDEYFLLGDNPPGSIDSRHFGPVRRDQIRGRADFIGASDGLFWFLDL